MKIWTDGAVASPVFLDGKWRWLIEDFESDASTLLYGSGEEVYAIPVADTEIQLTAKIPFED